MVANRLLVLLALCGAAGMVPAQQAQQAPPKADPRVEVASHIPGTRPEELHATAVAGIYELTRGADIVYVTADGKYAFTGDLVELASNSNLTEQHRRELRAKAIGAFPEDDMLIFGPKDPKYTVTVFTDVDCPYCRKLHSQIGAYNRLGIRVRYLLYPRTGPNTGSWTKSEQVWCSPDHNAALTRAKLGEQLTTKPCPNNPVARSYALGQNFALEGTPAIIMPDGELLPGYVPPDVLAQHLKDGK
ncbi:MAG TPA: DsbC family protein [Steroidobacteraceae bacterium]|jgi:thiol:disulfide interchange protein DsbC|nr:DsbC family protein [Steroidobacteraceae bacterium]